MRNLKINYWGFFGFLGFYGFKDPAFFLFFLFFIFFFVPKQNSAIRANGGIPVLVEEQKREKAEHEKKILEFLKSAKAQGRITNDDVQNLLGVSDATAERYLNELEKESILAQKGEKKGVFYEKRS